MQRVVVGDGRHHRGGARPAGAVRGETTAWVQPAGGPLYPPDLAESGEPRRVRQAPGVFEPEVVKQKAMTLETGAQA